MHIIVLIPEFDYDNWYNAQLWIDTTQLVFVPVDGNEGGTGDDATRTELESAISAAELDCSSSVDGYSSGNYLPGARTTLKLAIDTAKAVEENSDATSVEITQAYHAIIAAVNHFKQFKVDVDFSKLKNTIDTVVAVIDSFTFINSISIFAGGNVYGDNFGLQFSKCGVQ